MKRDYQLLLMLCLLSLGMNSFAQYDNHLILKKGYKNKIHYLRGDEIRLITNRSEIPVIGMIQAIGEDFIVINDEHLPLQTITTIIHKRKSFNFVVAGKTLQVAGPGYLTIVGFNGLIRSIRPIWSVSTLITSGTLFLVGLLVPKLQQKNFVIGDKYYLRIVPADPEIKI